MFKGDLIKQFAKVIITDGKYSKEFELLRDSKEFFMKECIDNFFFVSKIFSVS